MEILQILSEFASILSFLALVYKTVKGWVRKKTFREMTEDKGFRITVILMTLCIIADLSLRIWQPLIGPGPAAMPAVFGVEGSFFASGIVGDVGDVQVGAPKFVYTPRGIEPHEYDFKYDKDGKLNPLPAKFGGVCWLSPANNFGTDPKGGRDLRGYNKLHWEARSLGDNVSVEFFIGGATWTWGTKDGKPSKIDAPYPDMEKHSFGTKPLTSKWQDFDEPLSAVPQNAMKRVVCGFGWVANWANNGIEPNEDGTGPKEQKRFEFEIKNIRYEKGEQR